MKRFPFAFAILFSSLLLSNALLAGPKETKGTSDEPESESEYGKPVGLLGPVVVGPKFTLLGTPAPFRVGLESKYANLVGLSVDYGFLPTLSFSSVSVKTNGWSLAGRYYPWKGAFYVGVGFGGQTLTGSKSEVVGGQPVTATIAYSQTFFAPQIGWRWTWHSGFFLGMELGAQVPVGHTVSVTTNADASIQATQDYKDLRSQVETQADKYGNTVLPWTGLIQIGYFL